MTQKNKAAAQSKTRLLVQALNDSDSDDEPKHKSPPTYNERAQFQNLKIRSSEAVFAEQLAYLRKTRKANMEKQQMLAVKQRLATTKPVTDENKQILAAHLAAAPTLNG
jgi:hypothetical protein